MKSHLLVSGLLFVDVRIGCYFPPGDTVAYPRFETEESDRFEHLVITSGSGILGLL